MTIAIYKNTVTGAYIDGVKEGRAFFDANPDLTLEEMERELSSATRLMRSHSDAMKDCFKGQRDFWKNQIKLKRERG